MSKHRIETAVFMTIDRNFPPEVFGQVAKALESSGVVDSILMTDQLMSWIPPCLWIPENTPLANVVPDIDSFPDWGVMSGYASALAPKLGMSIALDAIRRGPAELMQTMLTMANVTHGKSIYQIGAGELKQCAPYGWKRTDGLARVEDFYRAFHALWDSKEPVTLDGNILKFDRATLGVSRRHKPRLWGLGGGPKVFDMATSYADGFSTMAMMVWSTPEHAYEEIKKMKQQLESKGRDPEKFDFAIWAPMLVHEDEGMVEYALENEITKWQTCVMGRIIQSDWKKEGIEPPMPTDWHYAMKLIPNRVSLTEAREMMKKVTPEMGRKSWLHGSPKKVAADLQGFVEAGVTWISTVDMMPALIDAEASAAALSNSIDVCRYIKTANA